MPGMGILQPRHRIYPAAERANAGRRPGRSGGMNNASPFTAAS